MILSRAWTAFRDAYHPETLRDDRRGAADSAAGLTQDRMISQVRVLLARERIHAGYYDQDPVLDEAVRRCLEDITA